ncbi:MAG: hypothetical protein AAGA69_04815, partial [Pseudomonadota bacterium]
MPYLAHVVARQRTLSAAVKKPLHSRSEVIDPAAPTEYQPASRQMGRCRWGFPLGISVRNNPGTTDNRVSSQSVGVSCPETPSFVDLLWCWPTEINERRKPNADDSTADPQAA